MRCPICKTEISLEGNPYRPFCSDRCKLIDLDNWLEGRYRVPGRAGEAQDIRPSREEEEAGDERDKN